MGCCNNPNYQSRAARESINRSAYEACQCADRSCECKDLAEQYAQNAENTWSDFQTRYLGAYSIPPVTSIVGALYFNTVSNGMFVWNGTIWFPISSTSQAGPTTSGILTSTDWNTFNNKTYCITFGHSTTNFATGGTDVYFSNIFDLGPVTTNNRRQFSIPINGTIIAASLSFYNGGGATPLNHSGATMSLYNVGLSTPIAPIISYNVNNVVSLSSISFIATGLNIPVNNSTIYNIFLQAGTFSTAPSSVRQTINLFIR